MLAAAAPAADEGAATLSCADKAGARHRSPLGAFARSAAVPGWGQRYAGEPRWGATVMGVSTLLGAVGGAIIGLNFLEGAGQFTAEFRDLPYCAIAPCDASPPPRDRVNPRTGRQFLQAAGAIWVMGALEAPLAARRTNARLTRRAAGVGPRVGVGLGPAGQWRLALSVPLR